MHMAGDTVVGAVVRQLRKAFPTWKCYKEDQDQALERPCFFVKQINLQVEKQMNHRDYRNYRIQVQALAPRGESSKECYLRAVGEELTGIFRMLALSEADKVFGRNVDMNVVDDALIFSIEFPLYGYWEVPEEPKMGDLEINNL